MGGAIGCEPPKPIQSYSVPKPELVYEANHVDPGEPQDSAGRPLPLDDRMLAAFVPQGETAWFIKLAGPKDAVAPHAETFQNFVKSITFSSDMPGEPRWQTPEGWRESAGPPPRLATLTIGDAKPPLEVTVSSLPLSAGDVSAYVLLNVNRWRAQMSLRPISQQRLAKETTKSPLAVGSALVFDMLGKLQAAGMPGAPPMIGHPPIASKAAGDAAPADEAAGIKFDTPDGWQAAPRDAFSQVALEAGEGTEQIRVTFSALSAAASDLTSNVNRWRSQVGLASADTATLASEARQTTIGGEPGAYVELLGPEEAILGAIVVHGEKAWFLKLRGSKSAALAQQDNFQQLLKSIRFE